MSVAKKRGIVREMVPTTVEVELEVELDAILLRLLKRITETEERVRGLEQRLNKYGL